MVLGMACGDPVVSAVRTGVGGGTTGVEAAQATRLDARIHRPHRPTSDVVTIFGVYHAVYLAGKPG